MQSIRWGEHSILFTHSVSILYRNSGLTDCILDVEGELIHVHKIIIAAFSPYFMKLLLKDHGIKLILMKNVPYRDMKLILDFMYYGEANICITDVTSLMETAELLKMTSLKYNFQKEFSCKDTTERSMDDLCSVPCTNQIGLDTKNLMLEEVPYNPVILHMEEERLSSNSKGIHVGAIGDSSAKYLNNFQDVSGKSNIDQSKSSAPYTCDIFKKNTNQENGNKNEELVPFTFVAVSEIEEANEKHQDDLTCFDSVLKDPLGEYSGTLNVTEERSVKEEFTFKSEPLVKKEPKNENDVPESVAEGVLISDNWTHSFHELASEKFYPLESCDQESGMYMNPYVTLNDTYSSEGCVSEKTRDFDIKFESICEISGAEEKKVFGTGQGLNHIVRDDTKTAVLEARNELLNSGVEHFSNTALQQVVNEEVCDANTNAVSNSCPMEIGNKTPATYESPASSSVQTIFDKERKKLTKTKESDSSCHDDETLIPKKQITFQPFKRIEFPCNICGKKFREVCVLRLHMRLKNCEKELHSERKWTHTSDRAFECEVCKKSFSQKHLLNMHMRYHTGDKPFECEVCKETFYRKTNLNKHMQYHTGDKPFECELCKKSFYEKHHLKTHMQTHSGGKPYECEVCENSFSQKQNLNIHMRTHDGVKAVECDVCKKGILSETAS